MKLLIFIAALVIGTTLLPGCNSNSSKKQAADNSEQVTGDSIPDGERTTYYENGKIHYIVEYHNGKANGRVREYTPDGKMYMDAVFTDGQRNGKCTHFYKNDIPFEDANYVNGEKDGVVSKFYTNGKLLATILYKKNKLQTGLREYQKDGTEINNDNSLVITEIDHSAREGKYLFKVSLTKPMDNTVYYASPKSDPDSREKLIASGNSGILEVPVSSRHFEMTDLIFQAEYKTRLGNTMRINRLYHHVPKH